MRRRLANILKIVAAGALCGAGAMAGCQSIVTRGQQPTLDGAPAVQEGVLPFQRSAPTEKDKTSLPTYVIEPPDTLLIDAVKLVPKPPYKIEPLDILQILVIGTLMDQPISGQYPVDPGGMVDLGPSYGKVRVSGLTFDDAKKAIDKHLRRILREPEVSVSLAQSAGQQQIGGEHLVGPDGTVNLGTYGRIYVAGMTVAEARAAIEQKLSEKIREPKVSVDIFTYGSKFFYVITEGAGNGDNVLRVPITGNETVLDAICAVNGTSRLSSQHMWIARPAPGGLGCDQVLPVNWKEITKGGATATNYQMLPGDRLFIAESKMVAFGTYLSKITSPFERALGVTLLGTTTIQTSRRFPKGFAGGVL